MHWIRNELKSLIVVPDSQIPDGVQLLHVLKACTATGDVQSLVSHLKRFNGSLDLKCELEKTEDIIVVLWGILSESVFAPLLEITVVLLIKLFKRYLKKSYHNPSQALTLDWEKCFNHLHQKLFFPPRCQRPVPANHQHLSLWIKLMGLANQTFADDSLDLILKKLRPLVYPNHWNQLSLFQGYLVMFYPVKSNNLRQSHLEEIFKLWDFVNHSNTWDCQFLFLISRIASMNVGVKTRVLDFSPFLERIFQTGLKLMDVPIGGDSANPRRTDYPHDHSFMAKKKDRMASFSKFIISLLNGKDSKVIDLIEKLLKSVDNFFHPSNSGRWSYNLTSFLTYCSKYFVRRWTLNDSHDGLTVQLKDRFVTMLGERTLLALFGKDSSGTNAACTTLKHLTFLAPELLFPQLLDQVIGSLETLTETHRTTSAITALSATCRNLLDWSLYPEGACYLPSILSLTIPGIDPNDIMKTMLTLTFYSHLLMTITIVDVSSSGSAQTPNEIEAERSTAYFEEWVMAFIDRLWIIFEYLPEKTRNNDDFDYTMEDGMIRFVWNTCDLLFTQLSNELHGLALKKLESLVHDKIFPNASQAVAYVCGAAKGRDALKCLSTFIPLCHREIMSEIGNGVGSDMNASETSVSNLLWYSSILRQVIYQGGSNVSRFEKELTEVAVALLSQPHKLVNKAGSKFFSVYLESISSVYPLESSSISLDQWKDENFMKTHYRNWGQAGNRNNIAIEWFHPGEDHLDMSMRLLDQVWVSAIAECRALIAKTLSNGDGGSGDSKAWSRLRSNLQMFKGAYSGICTLLLEHPKDNTSDEDDGKNVSLVKKHFGKKRAFIQCGYSIADPASQRYQKLAHILEDFGNFLNEMAEFFLQKKEDDVESIKIITKIIASVLSNRGIDYSEYDGWHRAFNIQKRMICSPKGSQYLCRHLQGTRFMPFMDQVLIKLSHPMLVVKRVYLYQLLCFRKNSSNISYTEISQRSLENLIKLGASRYSETRKLAQSALNIAIPSYPHCRKTLTRIILDILMEVIKDARQSEKDFEQESGLEILRSRLKGALYMLAGRPILSFCLQDMEYIYEFVIRILALQFEQKPSIQDLIRKLFLDFYNSFRGIACVPNAFGKGFVESVGDRLSNDWDDRKYGSFNDFSEKHQIWIKDKIGKMETFTEKLMTAILEKIKKEGNQMHWRYQLMAANFIDLFLPLDKPVNEGIFRYFLTGCTNDHPAIRKISIICIRQILYHMKTLVRVSSRRVSVKVIGDTGTVDLPWSQKLPYDESKFYLDNNCEGWLAWSEDLTLYPIDAKCDPELQPDLHEILKQTMVESGSFWKTFLDFQGQDQSNHSDSTGNLASGGGSSGDNFNHMTFQFYCRLTRILGDSFLDHVIPILMFWVSQKSDEKSKHKAAAEIISGILRGMKHWPLSQQMAVWESKIKSLVQKYITVASQDSLSNWHTAFKNVMKRRDPKRLFHQSELFGSLADIPNDMESFSAASRQIMFARTLFHQVGWRRADLLVKGLAVCVDLSNSPYKQVRQQLGTTIHTILAALWTGSLATRWTIESMDSIVISMKRELQRLLDKLEKERLERKASTAPTLEKPSDYVDTSKTILYWLNETLTRYRAQSAYPFIEPFLQPLIQMNDSDENDLLNMAHILCTLVSKTSPPSTQSIVKLLAWEGQAGDKNPGNKVTWATFPSWKVKLSLLVYFQSTIFRNIFYLDVKPIVGSFLLPFLKDSQLEVREFAGQIVSGLVRCSAIQPNDLMPSIDGWLNNSSRRLKKKDFVRERDYLEALIEKHAGILALSAIILAFPYTVPPFLPEALVRLVGHLGEPNPIQATVKKTISDFRRTHQDRWHDHVKQFTSDQLELVSEVLISPSYYA